MSASRRKGGEVSREELLAYVDGQLSARKAARIEAWLRAHPEDVALVVSWRRQNLSLDALYPRHEAERHVAGMLPAGKRATSRRGMGRFGLQLAAALVLLAVGLGGGWFARGFLAGPGQVQLEALVEEAMAAHAVYAPEVLHPVEVGASNEDHLLAWLSKRLGARIVVPDLSASGYRLMGGRLLPSGERAAAQFMYEDDAGHRITIYVAPAPKGRLAAFRFDERDGLGGIYWRDESLEYAVVGPLGRESLMQLASEVYRQLI